MENCIFCKIVAGQLPASKVYEDDDMIVFKDIQPIAKVHLLAVPKQHFKLLSELNEERRALVGRMLEKIASNAPAFGLSEGYRLIINQGEEAGQSVPHLHIHILGGQKLGWE